LEEFDTFTKVYLGSEISAMDPKVRKCVERAVEGVRTRTDCDAYLIEHISIAEIDECYRNVEFPETGPKNLLPSVGSGRAGANKQRESTIEEEIEREVEKWSFGNALIFTFSVITTIGMRRARDRHGLLTVQQIWSFFLLTALASSQN
uniref:RGS domain-containing protein n=1 Tax=Haemonchus placei TaxID=6290 RepID=A0A0N4VWZ9_HAEPC